MTVRCYPQSRYELPIMHNSIRLPPISTQTGLLPPTAHRRNTSQSPHDWLEGLSQLQTSSPVIGDGPGSNIPGLRHVVTQPFCNEGSAPSQSARACPASPDMGTIHAETWLAAGSETRSVSLFSSRQDDDSSSTTTTTTTKTPAQRGSALAKHKHTKQQQRQRRELTLKIKMLEEVLERRVFWRGDRRQTGQRRAQRAHQAGLPRPANNATKSGLTYEKGVIIDGAIGATAALATVLEVLGIDPAVVGALLPRLAFQQMSATVATELDGDMVDSIAVGEFEGIIQAAKVRMVDEAFRELQRKEAMP